MRRISSIFVGGTIKSFRQRAKGIGGIPTAKPAEIFSGIFFSTGNGDMI
jgi:hypothetical protein